MLISYWIRRKICSKSGECQFCDWILLPSVSNHRSKESDSASFASSNRDWEGLRPFKDKVAIGIFGVKWCSSHYLDWRVTSGNNLLSYSYQIVIQSEKPVSLLEDKIELFLDLLRKSILEMSNKDYALHVSSLVLSLSEKPKYLAQETWQHWCNVRSGVYEFQSREINSLFFF